MERPRVFIEHRWVKREGFQYTQPQEYVGRIKLTLKVLCNFQNTFDCDYSKAVKESNAYRKYLKEIKYYGGNWHYVI